MSQVVEINDLETLAGHQLAWNSLFPQTRSATFFQTYAWLAAYWRHYGQRQRLKVLLVRACDEPVGILPLCVRGETYRVGRLRVLTYPLHDWGSYYGPIGPNPTVTLLAGLRYLQQSRRDWDLLDLRWTDRHGVDHGRTPAAMRQVGFAATADPYRPIAAVDLSEGWEAYLRSRTSKWRNNYRRNERQLAERGNVELVRYRPPGGLGTAPRWDLYDMCERVASRSWQAGSSRGTTLSDEAVRDFLRDVHRQAALLGMVDLNLLLVDGEPAAFAYNYHYAGCVQGLRSGFDPAFSKDGAGTVLYARMLQDSCARQDRCIDFGAGYLQCKRHWITHVEASYRYTHFPVADVRAQLLRAKRWLHRRQAVQTQG